MHQHHRHHDRSRRLQESVHRTFEHSRGGGAKRGREEGGNNHSPYHHDDHGRHAHRERRWQHSEHETEEAAAHKRPRAETSASSSSAEASRLPLEAKLIDLLRCLTPTKEERGRRDAALQDVLRTLRSIGLRAEVYGSLRTGVLIPSSDIDCVMIPLEDKGRMPPALSSTMNNLAVASVLSSRERKQSFSRGIRVVANAMRSARCFRGITSVAHAKVPIVKCIHRNDDIKIDLSFEKDGCTSSQFLCDEFQKPGNELARPLIILVKSLVTHHGLDDPSMGGLGSFPISLMVLFYLKTEVPANYPEELQQSVAVLFAGFLRFFSGRFDFRRSGIDYVRANTFTKPPSTELFIVNPVRPGTNCAKAATLFATRVVPCFQEASKVFCGLLEHHADERRIEEAMCRFFSSAVPACADWREVEKAARHCRAAPPNRWDEHTHIYTGGVL